MPKHDLVSHSTERGEGPERLLADHRRLLIGGRDDTAFARLYHFQLERSDPDVLPAVFGEGICPAHHEVGAEPIHRQRCRHPAIQIIQRRLADEQKGKRVGEARLAAIACIERIQRALYPVRHMGQPHFLTQKLAEPAIRLRLGATGVHHISPHHYADRTQLRREKADLNRGLPFGLDGETFVVHRDPDQGKAPMRPLAQKHAPLIDQHPAPIKLEAEPVYRPGIRTQPSARLDGIDVNGGEVHGAKSVRSKK